jgi:hypothetical protein
MNDSHRVMVASLGGKDHFAADLKGGRGGRPQMVSGARANRSFLTRVVRYLAEKHGICQFLDFGTGLPAPDNTHQVAQAIACWGPGLSTWTDQESEQ